MCENVLPALDPRGYWVSEESTSSDLKSPVLTGVRVRLPPPAPMFIRVYENHGIYHHSVITFGVTAGVTLDAPFSPPIRGETSLLFGGQLAREWKKCSGNWMCKECVMVLCSDSATHVQDRIELDFHHDQWPRIEVILSLVTIIEQSLVSISKYDTRHYLRT